MMKLKAVMVAAGAAVLGMGSALAASAEGGAYAWRGFHFDEARHFFGKETVKDYLGLLGRLRFNVFHWHLTDDQGWRLDVPGFPELVKYGAVRSSTPLAKCMEILSERIGLTPDECRAIGHDNALSLIGGR